MPAKILKLAFLLGVIFSFHLEHSFAQAPLSISDQRTYPVREHLQMYEASPGTEIDEVLQMFRDGKFHPIETKKPLNFGLTSSVWWFALPVNNEIDLQNEVILMAASQGAALITLYEEAGNEFIATDSTGYSIPASGKKLDTRLFSFELTLKPNEEKLYFFSVDTRGGNLYLPFYMDAPHHYWAYESSRATHYGFFLGIFFLAFFLALFFYLKTREKIYGDYTLYILLSLLLILEEDGYAYWWIYGDLYPQFAKIMIPFTGTLAMYFLLQIMLAFHNFTHRNFAFFRYIKVFQYSLMALAAANLLLLWLPNHVLFHTIVFNLSFTGIILAALTALSSSMYKLRKGYKPAMCYLLAMSIMLIGISNYSLNSLGITTTNLFYPNGIVAGITLEIIIMMLALAFRYHQMKTEKEELLLALNLEKKAVSDQILKTLEDERERLAKDLHDDLGGLLAIIKMKISHLREQDTSLQPDLHETYKLIRKACSDLRAISHDLVLEGQSLRSLQSMIDEIIRHHESMGNLTFQTYYKDIPELKQEMKITIFRMVNELIQNVVRHSQATECNLQLIYDKPYLQIMCEDNGIGFQKEVSNIERKGIGLTNLQSRIDFLKGEMHVESNTGGTTFIFQVPFFQPIEENA